jgi:hypothetical protein
VFYKWFTAVCSVGKPVTGPLIIEKAKLMYDEMKVTDSAHSLMAGYKSLKNTMVLERWILVVKCSLLILKLHNGLVNYSIIWWNSINCKNLGHCRY